MKKFLVILMVLSLVGFSIFATGNQETETVKKEGMSVLVYVTGVTAGSPTYEMMVEGANDFAEGKENVKIKVYEAGFNQAEWESQLTDLVATGEYDVVMASNPSLPEICQNVANKFSKVKFIITDAEYAKSPQIRTFLYNQYEQSLFLGYLAGLVTESDMEFANSDKKIGFIAAQEYPLLTKHIVPGLLDGARMVDPEITLDFRIVGNWFDADKCSKLAESMIAGGVDVFGVIAGGAGQGLFNIAQQDGAYIVFHNTNEYATLANYIVGCGQMKQQELVEKALNDAYDGTLEYGKATTVGINEGYIDFIDTDPMYKEVLSEEVRTKFDSFLKKLRNGEIEYTLPSLY